jgi:hypothetical protein
MQAKELQHAKALCEQNMIYGRPSDKLIFTKNISFEATYSTMPITLRVGN